MSNYVIKEGVEGVWSYHLAKPGEYRSLCGRHVMNTALRRDQWGTTCGNESIHYKWCSKCARKLAAELETTL